MQNTPHVNLLYTPALREERVVDAVAGVVIDPRRFSEERVGDGVGKSYKRAAAAAAAQLRAPTRFKNRAEERKGTSRLRVVFEKTGCEMGEA